jgi:rhodanese-related sulfurtransferase
MQTISREELNERLANDEIAVVDVLDEKYYRKFHLPGASNVPLGDEFESQIQQAVPDKEAPVAVYCMDEECEASPKAAKWMEQLGYQQVYDYQGGKVDWKEAGLPTER